MKRYADNLKVTLGGVFNDVLIVGVNALTVGLKEANAEAEKLSQQDKLAEAGKELVMMLAVIADGLSIVWSLLKTIAFVGVSGFTQLYYAAEAFSHAVIGDFKGAKNSLTDMVAAGKAATEAVADEWSKPTRFQDAAKAMYAERDANKALEESKRKQLETQQMANGKIAAAAAAADNLTLIVEKNRNEWAKIVVSQLESTGEYEKAATEAIRLNQLTKEYKTLKSAATGSEEAAAALRAQELLEQQQLLAAKRKLLQMDTDHQATMIRIERSKLSALGYDDVAIQLMTGKLEAANQEAELANQIATEINPKLKAQLQEQLEAQRVVNGLVQEEVELRNEVADAQKKVAAYNDLIKMAQAAGEDAKLVTSLATQVAYDAKRLELTQQITKANQSGQEVVSNITSQTLQQLENLWAQKDASAANLAKLREVLGVQQEITAESNKKSNNDLIDEYNANINITRTKDEQYQYYKDIQSGFERLNALESWGATWFDYIQNQAKVYTQQYEKEQAEKSAAEAAKAMSEKIAKAASDISTAAIDLARSGQDMAKSLRDVASNLRSARTNLAGSSTSILPPEEQLALARTEFLNTAAAAQTTGDVKLYDQLPELARTFLELSKTYNASGTGFVSDFNTVQSILAESANAADSQASSAEVIVSLLQQQTNLLTNINAALGSGGATAGLLSSLYTVNNQINSAIGTANATLTIGNDTASAINTNTANTALHAGYINTNTANTATHAGGINENTGTTATHAGYINTNTANTATQAGGINTNTANTASYTSGINENTGYINTNTANTASYTGGINENTGYINTNTANTATHTGGINENTGYINTNTANTASYTNYINTNTANTATHAGGINVNTSSGGTLAWWLSSVNTQATNTASYTSRTRDVLNGSLMASQSAGRVSGVVDTYAYKPNSTTQIDHVTSTYSYYAKGGIADDPTGHSIFGEAGPEAAVPLPDGRTIPVTLYGAADNRESETVEELKKANAELRAAVRLLQAGFSQLVDNTGRQARSLNGIENKARLAANQ
jgi:hypothetical protein